MPYAEDLEANALGQGGFDTGHMDVKGPLGPIYNTLYRSSRDLGKKRGKGGSSILATVAGASGSENIDPQGYEQLSHPGAPYEYGNEMGQAAEEGQARKDKRGEITTQQTAQQAKVDDEEKLSKETSKVYQEKYGSDPFPKDASGQLDQAEITRRVEECKVIARQRLGIVTPGASRD